MMNKYRFKTKQEMLDEYGKSIFTTGFPIKGEGGWIGWNNNMNYLFGTELDYDFPDDIEKIWIKNKYCSIASVQKQFIICKDMLTYSISYLRLLKIEKIKKGIK